MSRSECDCKCVTAGTLLARVRSVVNDDVRACGGATAPDYTHWSTPSLMDYLNEGLSLLVSMRPDAYTVTEDITLAQGSAQTVPDGYDALVSVVANVSEDGLVSASVASTDDTYAHVAPSMCDTGDCAASAPYAVASYSVYPQSQREFTVAPPVPAGQTVKVRARLVKDAPCLADVNACVPVPAKFQTALAHWVLHRAFSKDIESAFAVGMADRYYRWFFDVLEAQRLAESRFRSGYNLGMVGDEDGQLRNR